MSTSPRPINAPSSPRGQRRRRPLTEPLDLEWQRLRTAASTRRRLRAWAADDPVLAPFRGLDELLDATGRALPMAQADQVLATLVRRAANDELAARIALQRLLPGLLKVALRRGATGRWRAAPLFDELTAAGWIVVRTFPIERRPTKIAVNLLRDAEYEVCVRPFRRLAASEIPHGIFSDDELDGQLISDDRGRPSSAVPHPSDELAEVLAQGAEAALSPDDLDLLRRLYLASEPVADVARSLCVSPRTVLSRRRAATERLRRVAA